METKKIIKAYNYFDEKSAFDIIWERIFMSCTFAVGVDLNNPNELSIFCLVRYDYICINTLFLNIYKKYNCDVVEIIKEEMTKIVKEVLTGRIKDGTVTVDQVEKMARAGLLTIERKKSYVIEKNY